MDIELLKQELLRRLTPPSVRTPIGTIPSVVMAPLHYGALGPMAPEVNTATNTPQGLDTMRAILAIVMAGQAGQQGLQQLQGGMLQNRYNAGVEGAYNRLPEGLFNPAQSGAIKSRLGDYVIERMPELNPSIVPMFSGAGVPAKVGQPFNIRSIQLLSNLPQETMTPNQVLGFLSGKVRKSEMEGLGLKEFLQGKEKVSKQDLLAHIEQSTPQIEEVVKEGFDKKPSVREDENVWVVNLGDGTFVDVPKNRASNSQQATEYALTHAGLTKYNAPGNTKFASYQLPGATNYREVVVKAPESQNEGYLKIQEADRLIEPLMRKKGNKSPYDVFNEHELAEWNRLMDIKLKTPYKSPSESTLFRSSHWDEPNPLFHRRVNERTSYKSTQKNDVLFGEEFQSDWAKKGRTEGFARDIKPDKITVKFIKGEHYGEPNYPGYWESFDKNGELITRHPGNMTENAVLKDAQKTSKILGGVPSHPLLKNWLELNLKGFIKDAIETGKRYISWTTGEQQAERYDLSKQVDELGWVKKKNGNWTIEGFKGKDVVIEKNNITDKDLDSLVGKEIAKRIREGEGKESGSYIESVDSAGSLKGEQLKIGGEWAKNLYDKQIPNILRDLTGGHITEILMPTGTKDKNGSPVYLKQPALELTPEIKDEIKKKGFDLFSALPKYEGENFINIKKQKEPKKIHYQLA